MVEHSLIQNTLKIEKLPKVDIFSSSVFFFNFTSLLFSKNCIINVTDQMLVNQHKNG